VVPVFLPCILIPLTVLKRLTNYRRNNNPVLELRFNFSQRFKINANNNRCA
jgi:hypothetical protein